jgi:hypothetical protein
MSLINDALKKAKEAQQDAAPPPAPNLQLRPIEPAQVTRQGFGVMVPAAFVVVALLLLFLIWQRTQRNSPAHPADVQARTAMPAQPNRVPPAPATVAVTPTAPATPEAAPAPAPALVTEFANAATAASNNAPAVVVADSEGTHTPAATEAAPPKPALPKLQAVIFSPIKPSVMINGKTLFVDDKVNGLRVAAIDRDSVTLVGGGQTNVLSLSE